MTRARGAPRARRRLAAALATAVLALASGARAHARPGAPEAAAQDAGELDRLRLLVGLDRGAEALERFGARVRPGGAWSDEGEAIALVARALVAGGEEERALELLRAARPARAAGLVALESVRTLLALDRLDEALAALAEERDGTLVLRAPDEPEALLLFARVQARRGRHEGVLDACRRFLARAPRHPEAPRAWHLVAGEALARRDLDAAREAFAREEESQRWNELLRARELQVLRAPDEALPRLGLALLWLEAGEPERARAQLLELLRRHPDEARAWFRLGEAERALGRSPLPAYDRALALAPDLAEALYRRGMLRLGADDDAARFGERDRAGGRVDLERLVEALDAALDPERSRAFRDAWWALARERRAAGDAPGADALLARYRELGGER